MKLTMGILLVSIGIVRILDIIMHGRRGYDFKALGAIAIAISIIIIWYYHSYQLDHQHPPFVFLTETRSYWQTYC
jgi:hypothetical protein